MVDPMTIARTTVLVGAALLLSGCELIVLDAPGDVAAQQGDLIIYATVLMLIVIVPVMALTVFFAFKYRESNKDANYEPDWDHSISLEIVVWSVPLAIIICLAGLTWVATHRLEPYDPLRRISEDRAITPFDKPMVVQVVAMDWKWLFIYPEHGIATVNEAAAIVDRPIEFQLTSATVMNSFYIPALAGQIYAMAGMQTELNAVMNEPGTYHGISANYSGAGFSHMHFDFHAFDQAGFDEWVATVKAENKILDREAYVDLEDPTINHPIVYFGGIENDMWERIVNMCVGGDDLCRHDMMMVDALGGGGVEGLFNRELYSGLCSVDDPRALYAMLKPSKLKTDQDIEMLLSALYPVEDDLPQSRPLVGAE
ncbi:MAG: ubiquinol oxidase subunit II [Pseudomonadota bacterium]